MGEKRGVKIDPNTFGLGDSELQHHLFELGDSGEETNWERNQASESESSVTWEKD